MVSSTFIMFKIDIMKDACFEKNTNNLSEYSDLNCGGRE